MARVITFSTVFPSYHPQAGQPTFFVEKIWESFRRCQNTADDWRRFEVKTLEELLPLTVSSYAEHDFTPKYHTIRAGNRWKVGDKFSPRVWSGVPYQSPQIIIGPDIEIPKIWGLDIEGTDWFIDGRREYALTGDGFDIIELAKNDGLSLTDFDDWFVRSPEFKRKLAFSGQVICWNDKIEY